MSKNNKISDDVYKKAQNILKNISDVPNEEEHYEEVRKFVHETQEKHKGKKDKIDIPAIVSIIIILIAFIFFGFWIGVLTFIINSVFLGWKDRHKGPFPTDKNKFSIKK